MNEFDSGRQMDMRPAPVAGDLRRGEGEHRPQALAARFDQMSGELGDQRHAALHAIDDQRIDGLKIAFD